MLLQFEKLNPDSLIFPKLMFKLTNYQTTPYYLLTQGFKYSALEFTVTRITIRCISMVIIFFKNNQYKKHLESNIRALFIIYPIVL